MSRSFLTGLCPPPLVALPEGGHVHGEAARPLADLRERGRACGFELQVVSGHRSFARQQEIWNAKARGGDRPFSILRYSAFPGASRHHWGTDVDVVDARALEPGQRVELTPAEVARDGPFGPIHDWLDGEIDRGQSCGFYRPYGEDRGGVAPERWHLSYAPLATTLAQEYSLDVFLELLEMRESQGTLLLSTVKAQAHDIYERFVANTCDP